MIRVWDPAVRVFHWGLVATIAAAWLTAEEIEAWHEWVGYIALGLIGFRLIWGLIGSRYARFSQFVPSVGDAISYSKDVLHRREKRYIGHNPLGALMVVALLSTTTATGVTGWMLGEPERRAMLPAMSTIVAPAYADSDGGEDHRRDDHDDDALEEVHEVLANLLLLLIVLHVAGVIYASTRHKEKLALAMITGNKPAPGPDDQS